MNHTCFRGIQRHVFRLKSDIQNHSSSLTAAHIIPVYAGYRLAFFDYFRLLEFTLYLILNCKKIFYSSRRSIDAGLLV